MTSLRHNGYLDSARAAILDVGWRRTTLTEVARRAGVSRMTIYRAWPDMESLMADLMTREWRELGAAMGEHDATTPESIAADASAVLAALRGNELFRRILDLDPELLLPYLLDRPGRSQLAILDLLTDRIAEGQRGGTVTEGDPAVLARTLLLASHGMALSARTMVDDTTTLAALDAGYVDLVVRLLRP